MDGYESRRRIHPILQKLARINSAEEGAAFAALTPDEILLLMEYPKLRLSDHTADVAIGHHLTGAPDDPELQRLFAQRVYARNLEALMADDPFWPHYPPAGAFRPAADMVIAGVMPTGDPIGIPADVDTSNVGIIGSTRSGKSSLLMRLIPQFVLLGRLVVAIDKKRELRHLATLPELQGRVTVLDHRELALSLFQPPPGVK